MFLHHPVFVRKEDARYRLRGHADLTAEHVVANEPVMQTPPITRRCPEGGQVRRKSWFITTTRMLGNSSLVHIGNCISPLIFPAEHACNRRAVRVQTHVGLDSDSQGELLPLRNTIQQNVRVVLFPRFNIIHHAFFDNRPIPNTGRRTFEREFLLQSSRSCRKLHFCQFAQGDDDPVADRLVEPAACLLIQECVTIFVVEIAIQLFGKKSLTIPYSIRFRCSWVF